MITSIITTDTMTIRAPRRIEPPTSERFAGAGRRALYATLFWVLSVVLFWQPLSHLAGLAWRDERFNHILVVPFLSALLVYVGRHRIFRATRYSAGIAVPLLLLVGTLWYTLRAPASSLNPTTQLCLLAFFIVLTWIAGFILCYGPASFKAGAFPLLFLLLMIPPPGSLLDFAVAALQKGSAATVALLFQLLGVPYTREGFPFSLPGATIEVAEQCSGIHSAIALFITSLLAGHFLLQSTSRRICLSLLTVPIAIFKNAVRIVIISCLGIYVNPLFSR